MQRVGIWKWRGTLLPRVFAFNIFFFHKKEGIYFLLFQKYSPKKDCLLLKILFSPQFANSRHPDAGSSRKLCRFGSSLFGARRCVNVHQPRLCIVFFDVQRASVWRSLRIKIVASRCFECGVAWQSVAQSHWFSVYAADRHVAAIRRLLGGGGVSAAFCRRFRGRGERRAMSSGRHDDEFTHAPFSVCHGTCHVSPLVAQLASCALNGKGER